nr:hypothetical protein [Tanacetum cinerariifolium]
MPFRSKSEVERLLAIPTPPLSPVSLTSYTLPPLLTPLPIYTPLPTSSFPLPSSIPSTLGSESIPEADIPLLKRARFTTPTSRYEIGRLRRERRYFRTVATTYTQEVAHSCDYYAWIMDYCQSREVHTSTLVTQMEALRRDVSTLQRSNLRLALCKNDALTWWNSYVKTTTPEEAYAMTWATLKKKMNGKYYPRVIEFTTELMEDKTKAYAERQADNKRNSKDIARNN